MSKPVIIFNPSKIPDSQLVGRFFYYKGAYTTIKVMVVEVQGIFVSVVRCADDGFRYRRESMYVVEYNNMYLLWDCVDYWYPKDE